MIMLQPLTIGACGASTQYYLQGKPCLPDKSPRSDLSMPKYFVSVSGAGRCASKRAAAPIVTTAIAIIIIIFMHFCNEQLA